MKKRHLLLVAISLIISVCMCFAIAGCNSCNDDDAVALKVPVVTIDDDGLAQWGEDENASGYAYKIDDGEEIATNNTSVTLADGESIVVKAKGDGKNYKDSGWSVAAKYEKPAADPLPLATPSVTIGKDGEASWAKVTGAVKYVYKLNGGSEQETTDRSVKLEIGQTIEVKAVGDGTTYELNGKWSTPETYTVKLDAPTVKISKSGLATWDDDDNAVKYSVKVNDGDPFDIEEAEWLLEDKDTIRVMALGDGTRYSDSDWSVAAKYEKPGDLSAPTVTIARDGSVTVYSENASSYMYKIGGGEAQALPATLKLENGQSISAQAISDSEKYNDSGWSSAITYYAPLKYEAVDATHVVLNPSDDKDGQWQFSIVWIHDEGTSFEIKLTDATGSKTVTVNAKNTILELKEYTKIEIRVARNNSTPVTAGDWRNCKDESDYTDITSLYTPFLNEQTVAKASAALVEPTPTIDNTTYTYALSEDGAYGTKIAWSVAGLEENEYSLEDGVLVIYRRLNAEAKVTLSATISYGGKNTVKTFPLTVTKRVLVPLQPPVIAIDERGLATWTDDDNAVAYVVELNDEVLPEQEDAFYQLANGDKIRVKAIGDHEYYSDSAWSLEHNCTILSENASDKDKVDVVIDNLGTGNPTISADSYDYTLPLSGNYGTKIAWSFAGVDNDGYTYNKDTGALSIKRVWQNLNVTATATVSLNDASETKDFHLIVEKHAPIKLVPQVSVAFDGTVTITCENASGYNYKLNGQDVTLEGTIKLVNNQMISVQALGDNERYGDSDWTTAITYKAPTVLPTPQNVKVAIEGKTAGKVVVSWDDVANATGYKYVVDNGTPVSVDGLSVTISLAEGQTVKVMAVGNENDDVVATTPGDYSAFFRSGDYEVSDPFAIPYENVTYSVAEIIDIITYYGTNTISNQFTVYGVVSSCVYYSSSNTYTIWLKNGEKAQGFELYKATLDENLGTFADASKLVGYTVTATGIPVDYNGTYEFSGCDVTTEISIENRLAYAKDALNVAADCYEDFELPAEAYGVTIVLSSDKEDSIKVEKVGNVWKATVTRTESDVDVVLTANLSYGDDNKDSATFPVTVKSSDTEQPVMTFAEFIAAAIGTPVKVSGVVRSYTENSAIYFQDDDGPYYVYGSYSAVGTLGEGKTIVVEGTKTVFGSTLEITGATVTVTDDEVKNITPINITDKVLSATSLSDAILTNMQYAIVTIENVTLDSISGSYYYFTIGVLKITLYISGSSYNDIKALFEVNLENTANITGRVSLYDGNFQLNPWDDNTLVITGAPKLGIPQVKIDPNTGVASWAEVENAQGYVVEINGEEKPQQTETTYTLTDGQTIRVKAVGDVVNYKDSSWSEEQTYTALPEGTTLVSVNINDYAEKESWTQSAGNNATKYDTIVLDGNISVSLTPGNNNSGSWWNDGKLRLYQTSGGCEVLIAASSGYVIVSVKITYEVANTGTLLFNGGVYASDSILEVGASSVVLTVGNTSTSATNGQVKISDIEVVYKVKVAEPLDTPDVKLTATGASWDPVDNARGYIVKVNGQEQEETTATSVLLNDGDTIQVKAVGDGVNYSESPYSEEQTYTKPTVAQKLASPTVEVDGEGTVTWSHSDTLVTFKYYLGTNLTVDDLSDVSWLTAESGTVKLDKDHNSIAVIACSYGDLTLDSDPTIITRLDEPTGFTFEADTANEGNVLITWTKPSNAGDDTKYTVIINGEEKLADNEEISISLMEYTSLFVVANGSGNFVDSFKVDILTEYLKYYNDHKPDTLDEEFTFSIMEPFKSFTATTTTLTGEQTTVNGIFVDIAFGGKGTSTAYNKGEGVVRAYYNNTVTVKGIDENLKIVKIEITYYKDKDVNTLSVETGTYTETTSAAGDKDNLLKGTWTGSSNEVVFTVGATEGTAGHYKLITIKVFYEDPKYDDTTKVTKAKSALTKPEPVITDTTYTYTLPLKGKYGTTIEWNVTSENSGVVSYTDTDGMLVVTRQSTDVTVTAAATIKSGAIEDKTVSYTFTVAAAEEVDPNKEQTLSKLDFAKWSEITASKNSTTYNGTWTASSKNDSLNQTWSFYGFNNNNITTSTWGHIRAGGTNYKNDTATISVTIEGTVSVFEFVTDAITSANQNQIESVKLIVGTSPDEGTAIEISVADFGAGGTISVEIPDGSNGTTNLQGEGLTYTLKISMLEPPANGFIHICSVACLGFPKA